MLGKKLLALGLALALGAGLGACRRADEPPLTASLAFLETSPDISPVRIVAQCDFVWQDDTRPAYQELTAITSELFYCDEDAPENQAVLSYVSPDGSATETRTVPVIAAIHAACADIAPTITAEDGQTYTISSCRLTAAFTSPHDSVRECGFAAQYVRRTARAGGDAPLSETFGRSSPSQKDLVYTLAGETGRFPAPSEEGSA